MQAILARNEVAMKEKIEEGFLTEIERMSVLFYSVNFILRSIFIGYDWLTLLK